MVGVLWRLFKEFARRLGDIQARLLLSVFYLAIIGPHALAVRLFADPLRLRASCSSRWLERDRPVPNTLAQARRQF